MKKFGKLMVAGLLASGLIIPFSGCVSPEPFVPPEGGGSNVNINDAYDWNEDETGSTRPDLGDGYEAAVPPKATLITIAEGSGVKFKGGENNFSLTIGEKIKPSDFDEATLGGHKVEGFAILDEDGAIDSFISLNDYVAAGAAVTVLPYFAPEKGESALFGSKKIGDYYFAADGTDLDDNTEYAIASGNALIENLIAKRISIKKPLEKGSYFRSVTVAKRETGKTYTYNFGFKNYGESAVSFTVYQMFAGYDWETPTNRVASDVITVEPGEYKTVAIKVRNTKKDENTLTLIKLEEDAEKVELGITMSVDDNTVKAPATITLKLPENFKVASSYNTNVMTGDALVLPSAAQINNRTGHNLLGWVYSNSNQTAVTEGTRIKGDITIEPVLTEDAIISFTGLPEGFTIKPEYETLKQTGDTLVLPTKEQISNTTRHNLLYWEYAEGGVVADKTIITESVTLKPVFTKDVTVTLELPAGITVSEEYVRLFQEGDKLVLPAAEHITNTLPNKIIRWVDKSGNPVDEKTVLNADITIKPELSKSATVNVILPAGLTLADDYITQVQTGDTLVLPTNEQIKGEIADGREIIGWYEVGNGNRILSGDVVVTDANMKIAPYFTRRAGTAVMQDFDDKTIDGKPLVFCNNQTNNKPMDAYGEAKKDNFTAITDKYNNTTPIGGGNGGYAELGNFLKYSGTLAAGDAFRAAAMVSHNNNGATVVALNKQHTFYYNFENLGTSALHLSIQGVNSGTNVEGPVSDIKLAPGESTCITFNVTYTKGSANRNVIAYFKVIEAVTDMKLGISINVVLNSGETSAAVAKTADAANGVDLSDAYLGAAVGGLKDGEDA